MKEVFASVKSAHASFQRFSSMSVYWSHLTCSIQPTAAHSRMSVQRSAPIAAPSKRDALLRSLPEEERSRLLSESVQIEVARRSAC